MSSASGLSAFAPAKVNLTLRIVGRRPDGYHELDSLVVFARLGDDLRLVPDEPLGLVVDGPTAASAGVDADNLVLKAARALAALVPDLRLGRFHLTKRLPVAAGLGGGSSDAAAALRLLAQANGLDAADPRLHAAARATGADVPVCLDPRPRTMRGIGEVLSPPVALAGFPAVLVNPGVAVPTKDVFVTLGARPIGDRPRVEPEPYPADPAALLARVRAEPNDLEAPAVTLQPVIADVLKSLRALSGCTFARMSGSGATCFGLFDTGAAAASAAATLRTANPRWWVEATRLG